MIFIGVDYPLSHTADLYFESINIPIVIFISGKIFPPILVNESANCCCFLTQQI